MEVNLKSVYPCSQALLPTVKRQGKGRIVNASSVCAKNGDSPSSAAKGGVNTPIRAMAKEFAFDGILVNAISPGGIDTPLHDEFTPDEKREEAAQGIPLRREGTAEEVAEAILSLASPRAKYILGEVIEVTGGLSMG